MTKKQHIRIYFFLKINIEKKHDYEVRVGRGLTKCRLKGNNLCIEKIKMPIIEKPNK